MKKLVAMALASMMVLSAVPVMAEEAGFEETPIGEEQDIVIEGFAFTNEEGVETESGIHVAAVYFQPVQMEPADQAGLTVEESNIHLEADIHWNENDLGFGAGDWLSYSTVDYKIVSEATGEVAAEGTFMVMNADDGAHYGANIKLDKADTYTLTFTIHSPVENGYLLHVDDETGVKGRFWTDPITVEFVHWEYTVQEW